MPEQKTKVFIDLDDTLFDTKSLKAQNYLLFNEIPGNTGLLSREEFGELLNSELGSHKGTVFTPAAMIELLQRKGYNTEGLAKRRKEMMKSANKYFKPEIYQWIVKNFPREKYEYIIYSYGDPNFQHEKLTACGIEKDFDKILYISTDKVETLQKYISQNESFVLFEDKLKIVEGVHQRHPNATIYHVDGLRIGQYNF